jgi:hypothetical protein
LISNNNGKIILEVNVDETLIFLHGEDMDGSQHYTLRELLEKALGYDPLEDLTVLSIVDYPVEVVPTEHPLLANSS